LLKVSRYFMIQNELSGILTLLNRIVDNIETNYGVLCPEWMILDVIAVSGEEHHLNMRRCCRRNMNSCGLSASRFLVVNNRYVLTCQQKSITGRKLKRHSFKKDPGKNRFSRRYRNAVLECVRLNDE
jgi:hypothetical protein